MTCREFVDFLMSYLDGEVPPDERHRFEEHLAECPDCVNYLRSYAETVKLGKAAFASCDGDVPEEVPEALVQAVLAATKKD